MNREKKGTNKIKIAAIFGIAIFAFSIFGYAMISTTYMPTPTTQKTWVHIHATLSIENVNMLNLKNYSDFSTTPPLHLHFWTTTSHIAIVHMETYIPKPEIKVFFNSIGFNTTGYVLYANDKRVGYNYVFKNEDVLNLMLKNTSVKKALINESQAHKFFNIFESGNVTKLKAFR